MINFIYENMPPLDKFLLVLRGGDPAPEKCTPEELAKDPNCGKGSGRYPHKKKPKVAEPEKLQQKETPQEAPQETSQAEPLDLTPDPSERDHFEEVMTKLGILVVDAVVMDIQGNPDPHYSWDYASKYKAFALSKAGATKIQNLASKGFKYIAMAVYPGLLSSMQVNPSFRAEMARQIVAKPGGKEILAKAHDLYNGIDTEMPGFKPDKKGAKGIKPGLKKGLTEKQRLDVKNGPELIAAKYLGIKPTDVAIKVGDKNFDNIGGNIVGLGEFKRVVPDEESANHPAHHEVYPQIVEMQNYVRLDKPKPLRDLVKHIVETGGSLEPKHIKNAWLMTQGVNLHFGKDESQWTDDMIKEYHAKTGLPMTNELPPPANPVKKPKKPKQE